MMHEIGMHALPADTTRHDWLCYAPVGKEFAVMDQLAEIGIDHWRGTAVKFERRGKSRTPDAYDYPALPNYIWASPLQWQVHLMAKVKYMSRTFLFLSRADVDGQTLVYNKGKADEREEYKPGLREFARAVDERERLARRIAGNRDAIKLYNREEQIQIVDGPFAGRLARFRHMAQGANDLFPKVVADVELFGGMTRVRFDPLAVDKVKGA
jgi:hypothetical protein